MQKLSSIEVNEICNELGEAYPKSIEQVSGGDIHGAWHLICFRRKYNKTGKTTSGSYNFNEKNRG